MLDYTTVTTATNEELKAALEINRNREWDLNMKDRWTSADRDLSRDLECEHYFIVNEMKKRGLEV